MAALLFRGFRQQLRLFFSSFFLEKKKRKDKVTFRRISRFGFCLPKVRELDHVHVFSAHIGPITLESFFSLFLEHGIRKLQFRCTQPTVLLSVEIIRAFRNLAMYWFLDTNWTHIFLVSFSRFQNLTKLQQLKNRNKISIFPADETFSHYYFVGLKIKLFVPVLKKLLNLWTNQPWQSESLPDAIFQSFTKIISSKIIQWIL